MAAQNGPAILKGLIEQSGVNFYSRRVLQRWQRGEITTDIAVELLQANDAQRLIDTWRGVSPS